MMMWSLLAQEHISEDYNTVLGFANVFVASACFLFAMLVLGGRVNKNVLFKKDMAEDSWRAHNVYAAKLFLLWSVPVLCFGAFLLWQHPIRMQAPTLDGGPVNLNDAYNEELWLYMAAMVPMTIVLPVILSFFHARNIK